LKIIFASFSEELGQSTNLELQRYMRSPRYAETFGRTRPPHPQRAACSAGSPRTPPPGQQLAKIDGLAVRGGGARLRAAGALTPIDAVPMLRRGCSAKSGDLARLGYDGRPEEQANAFPSRRFASLTPRPDVRRGAGTFREEPGAGKSPVRICEGQADCRAARPRAAVNLLPAKFWEMGRPEEIFRRQPRGAGTTFRKSCDWKKQRADRPAFKSALPFLKAW
jgi:hypothetical protein